MTDKKRKTIKTEAGTLTLGRLGPSVIDEMRIVSGWNAYRRNVRQVTAKDPAFSVWCGLVAIGLAEGVGRYGVGDGELHTFRVTAQGMAYLAKLELERKDTK